MGTLVLLRHAKAEPQSGDDRSRELAARGRADAAAVREWLVRQGIVPDMVVVSTATRTRQTWELASPGGAAPGYDDRVYDASTEELREIIGETPAEVGVLVLVGHNPSVERLAWELDDSPAARDRTDGGLPSSALAVFEVASWAEPMGAVLKEVFVPGG
jgi:phosphohistidine phosphatase